MFVGRCAYSLRTISDISPAPIFRGPVVISPLVLSIVSITANDEISETKTPTPYRNLHETFARWGRKYGPSGTVTHPAKRNSATTEKRGFFMASPPGLMAAVIFAYGCLDTNKILI
jgi:hypothetical protein